MLNGWNERQVLQHACMKRIHTITDPEIHISLNDNKLHSMELAKKFGVYFFSYTLGIASNIGLVICAYAYCTYTTRMPTDINASGKSAIYISTDESRYIFMFCS